MLGCAVFHNILKPVAVLSKTSHEEDLCTVRAIDSIMKTKSRLDKLRVTAFQELPSVKKVIGRIKNDSNNSFLLLYQVVHLKDYKPSLEYLETH